MDALIQTINNKLKEINQKSFEELDSKTQKRLIETETLIENSATEIEDLINKIRKLKLSKTFVANSDSTNFTRKTIYNDGLLEKYIEKCIQDENDYFNETKLERLYEEINVLKEQYDKILDNIIYTNVLRLEVEKYKKEILRLIEEKEKLKSINNEKEIIIRNLKNIMIANNITNIDILSSR